MRTARVPAVTGRVMYRPGRVLPGWATVLAVVAHPDDETFGLGAVLGALTADGAVVHLLCYTRGEASTLNESGASLRQARAEELRQASSALGVATVTLLDYPGPPGHHVAGRAGRQRHQADCPPPAGRDETGQPPGHVDLCIRVDRGRQRRAALLHASQISPAAVLWRRLQLQGDCEHLRWLRPPQQELGRTARRAGSGG